MDSEFLTRSLRNDLKDRTVSAVVGAGVSIAATGESVASWIGLIKNGVTRCHSLGMSTEWCSLRLQQIDANELLYAAEQISEKLCEKGEYAAWLRDTVGTLHDRIKDDSIIRAIARLRIPIITTNYDDVLRQATNFHRPITWKDHYLIDDWIQSPDEIFHVHGHWRNPDSVVFGLKSYDEVLSNTQAQAALRTLVGTRTLLFIGVGGGLDDPNFRALRQWISLIYRNSKRRHYVLLSESEMDTVRSILPSDSKLSCLSYGEEFCELVGFLETLCGNGVVRIELEMTTPERSGTVDLMEFARVIQRSMGVCVNKVWIRSE
jgi:hypothetical protein